MSKKNYENNKLYAFTLTHLKDKGLIKVGETLQETSKQRILQETKTASPIDELEILLGGEGEEVYAQRNDGSWFRDKDVHKVLTNSGFIQPPKTKETGTEWFYCSLEDVQRAIAAVKQGHSSCIDRIDTFEMREEQRKAVKETAKYFKEHINQLEPPPHYLWNAKMRFGKTFATYELAKEMKWKRVLVLTFKPAVKNSWAMDIASHVDFDGWEFATTDGTEFNEIEDPNREKTIIGFYSFQYLMKHNTDDKTKDIFTEDWDCIVNDEYHYGAWRQGAMDLYKKNPQTEEERIYTNVVNEDKAISEENGENFADYETAKNCFKSKSFLYLSGTAFRALATGEFGTQVFNWTYTDEQRAKNEWPSKHPQEKNPYAPLPKMKLLTIQLQDMVKEAANFDLAAFFEAEGEGSEAKFKNERAVLAWISTLFNQKFTLDTYSEPIQSEKFPFEFGNGSTQNHTLWFMQNVASCFAMKNLLERLKKNNGIFQGYEIICCAGSEGGVGVEALKYVKTKLGNQTEISKSITLTCGKLTTGVTVHEWSGILMLRNCAAPETYFQSAFRIQSPWVCKGPDGVHHIKKEECTVFDFDPNRALRMVVDYSYNLDTSEESSSVKKITDFTNFLPVIGFQGGKLKQIDASSIFEQISGTISVQGLLDQWNQPKLVHTDYNSLLKIQNNKDLMKILDNLSYADDNNTKNSSDVLSAIINSTDKLTAAKRHKENGEKKSPKELSEEKKAEKERLNNLEILRKRLRKLVETIRTFLYLTDMREEKYLDVANTDEPDIFEKVTHIPLESFKQLSEMGIIDKAEMSKIINVFKIRENSSLYYTGIDKSRKD